MGWKNENSQDVNTTKSNLQIQCIQYQNPNEAIFFCLNRKTHLKIYMESQ